MSRASVYMNPVNKGGSLLYEVLLKVRNREGDFVFIKSPLIHNGVHTSVLDRTKLRLFLERVTGSNTINKYKVAGSKAWFYQMFVDY